MAAVAAQPPDGIFTGIPSPASPPADCMHHDPAAEPPASAVAPSASSPPFRTTDANAALNFRAVQRSKRHTIGQKPTLYPWFKLRRRIWGGPMETPITSLYQLRRRRTESGAPYQPPLKAVAVNGRGLVVPLSTRGAAPSGLQPQNSGMMQGAQGGPVLSPADSAALCSLFQVPQSPLEAGRQHFMATGAASRAAEVMRSGNVISGPIGSTACPTAILPVAQPTNAAGVPSYGNPPAAETLEASKRKQQDDDCGVDVPLHALHPLQVAHPQQGPNQSASAVISNIPLAVIATAETPSTDACGVCTPAQPVGSRALQRPDTSLSSTNDDASVLHPPSDVGVPQALLQLQSAVAAAAFAPTAAAGSHPPPSDQLSSLATLPTTCENSQSAHQSANKSILPPTAAGAYPGGAAFAGPVTPAAALSHQIMHTRAMTLSHDATNGGTEEAGLSPNAINNVHSSALSQLSKGQGYHSQVTLIARIITVSFFCGLRFLSSFKCHICVSFVTHGLPLAPPGNLAAARMIGFIKNG